MQLKKIVILKATIRLLSGLHIGGSNERIEIGGMDNPVIKHPITGEPYIPGSSLKGKMRSLVEWYRGDISADGKPWSSNNPNDAVSRVFGVANDPKEPFKGGPTRLSIRDAFLTEASRSLFKDNGWLPTEDKIENSINRVTAEANPRHMERAVPGLEFDFEAACRVMEIDGAADIDEDLLVDVVFKGLKLLEMDALGGGGSRGNGKIKFENLCQIENGESELWQLDKVEL